MEFNRQAYTNEELISIYRNLLLPRMIEEKMLVLLRQGKISKWFSGIGQEAISVGATMALQQDEWVMPLHRNLGVFTSRNMPLHKLFMQWQGNKEGYSKGRERSFHFGTREHHICGMISHLGPQLAIADGVALAHQLRQEKKVSLAFSGDGGTSEGDFHEALNVAAVWNLPVIFIIENNGYGLSTPVNEQYRCESLVDKARGYGMEGVRIDGNNILSVYDTIKGVREYCIREQKPYLVECMTFRMRGHEEASGTKYVPKELFDEWGRKDPIKNFEQYLIDQQVITEMQVAAIRNETREYIETELQLAAKAAEMTVDETEEIRDVYAGRFGVGSLGLGVGEVPVLDTPHSPLTTHDSRLTTHDSRFVDAIQSALRQSMEKHANLVLMGQDIAEYGGAFKITEGFVDLFGKARVRNTPLCESAIVGSALGLSLEGFKSVMEMQFADFVTVGFNQIVNNLAKIHYRWGQNADVVIRMPTGAGVGAGPFHSQSNEAWFTHVPGLKVVYPATPHDAKGLLIAAINDPNPVMFFEHKALYRSVSGPVAETYYEVEIGKARLVKEGSDITVITYGSGVHWAMEYQEQHPEISIHVLDLRTLLPLDHAAIQQAVAQTGKVLVLHEDTLTGGIGGEISAWISEHCFELLDAPVLRCASLDTPIPFNMELEKHFLAKSRLGQYVQKLMNY
ncbi:MAG: dehydrogenase E1 component subunit alpha/beta [Chitinophagaceae bacterium]|nr:dehydrogenase E1 component subunit alpha/beta [Chitinophagaceae bacterium]MCA6453977.1 dehydrogenase E1 component subunit alpha/beta [Chitinophagaceae bacterium]MCA6456873.1 dehydrogenase E1 component subunit alpha/beta [Chitinophagaceae bacterium]MCA6458626.1 dehydrogenase E1 component subunit alpha/beta [Chitinophagaceae bacterium]MCA6466045.1 dehydrogenase E1 component subunit alpha/beta [Chitinophagaceae bacterium]